MLDDEEIEPPVPPGLGHLSASLKALAEFLGIDDDLIAVAADRSSDRSATASPGDLERWIANLPSSEKDALLTRLATGTDAHLHAEIQRRVRDAHAPRLDAGADGRTVADLLSAATERADMRRRQEAEREKTDQARREREQAAAREFHLDGLVGREEELLRRVEALIETKRPKECDQAVQLLTDLYDLSVRHEAGDAFAARVGSLRDRYAKRPNLLERLDRAGLTA